MNNRKPTKFVIILLFLQVINTNYISLNGQIDFEVGGIEYFLEDKFPNMELDDMVRLISINQNEYFAVIQTGIIYHIKDLNPNPIQTLFLNISKRVSTNGMEVGLLGMALHPNFFNNGEFFLNYIEKKEGQEISTVISRFTAVFVGVITVDLQTEFRLMEFTQPANTNNGGQLSFGPDGFLYISVGDGGKRVNSQGEMSIGDESQDLTSIYGTILRVDVDGFDENSNYTIPENNPFFENTQGYKEEIYAYGLRNTWSFSFDDESERMWGAEPGHDDYDELNLIKIGANYGWNITEGPECFGTEACNKTNLEEPIWSYNHQWIFENYNEEDPLSLAHAEHAAIIGGHEYHNTELMGLNNYYIFGEFWLGVIWALDLSNLDQPEVRLLLNTDLLITSFTMDKSGEILVIDWNGKVSLLKSRSIAETQPPTTTGQSEQSVSTDILGTSNTNPFSETHTISTEVPINTGNIGSGSQNSLVGNFLGNPLVQLGFVTIVVFTLYSKVSTPSGTSKVKAKPKKRTAEQMLEEYQRKKKTK